MNYREIFEELLKIEGQELKVQLFNLNGAQACIRRMVTKYNANIKDLSEDMQVKLVVTTVNRELGEYKFKLVNEAPRATTDYKKNLVKLVEEDVMTKDDDNFDWSLC